MRVKPVAHHGRTLNWLLSDIGRFARYMLGRPLRPYQLKVARAIVADVLARQRHRIQSGGLWTVMMARQMGKNEVSAVIEAYLLTRHAQHGGTIIKAAPTWQPQGVTSFTRLREPARQLPASRAGYPAGPPGADPGPGQSHLLLGTAECPCGRRDRFAATGGG